MAYDQLLTNLFVMASIPAWINSRFARLVKSPKRYLVDSALITTALGLDVAAVLRDGDLIGRVLDTFVVAQLRAEAEIGPARSRLHHFREKEGRHEVDVIVEVGTDLVGIEIKATASPTASDAAHLSHLRDTLGDRFLTGAVLHTGPRAYQLADRVFAVPICSLWA